MTIISNPSYSLLLAFLLTMFGLNAQAEICVQTNTNKDQLTDNERSAVEILLRNSFEKAGETVVDSPCEQTYTIVSIRLGRSITTTVSGPKGARSMKVAEIEELNGAVDQIALSLVSGSELGDSAGASVTRENVTFDQTAPNRIENDSVTYVNIGPGYITHGKFGQAPINLGGGYRYELDSFGLDINGQLVLGSGSDSDASSLQFSVGGVHFVNAKANHSLYFGGGLGLSTTQINEGDRRFDGGGLHAKVSAGYEFFRASTIRLLVQFDVLLPVYALDEQDTLEDESSSGVAGANDSIYAPVFGFSIGGGFSQKPNRLIVR